MPHISWTRYALWTMAGLVVLRVAVPLAALAAGREGLPGLPVFEYDGLTGDATGFYAAAREFMASWGRLPAALVAALALLTLAGAVALVRAWRGKPALRGWLVAAAGAWFALLSALAVTQMNPPGAAVVGWPIVWSLPMLPYRALGLSLDQDVAFVLGLLLSLAANAVTVVATAYAGLYATGRRAVGLAAAVLVALWPFLTGAVRGERAWENGTWAVDVGLAMYTEPLSTALVAVALALLLAPSAGDVRLAAAGACLGLAAAVKLSNGVLAAALLALLLAHVGVRRSLPFAAAGAAFVPLVVAYWPKGYTAILEEDPDAWPDEPFGLRYAVSSWTDSLLFTPRVLLLLVPLAVVGAFALDRRWPRRVLVAAAIVNPVVYSVYWVTAQHPRFLFASLPPTFVLLVYGAAFIGESVRRRAFASRRRRARPERGFSRARAS